MATADDGSADSCAWLARAENAASASERIGDGDAHRSMSAISQSSAIDFFVDLQLAVPSIRSRRKLVMMYNLRSSRFSTGSLPQAEQEGSSRSPATSCA